MTLVIVMTRARVTVMTPVVTVLAAVTTVTPAALAAAVARVLTLLLR